MFKLKNEADGSVRGLYVVFEGPDGSGKSTLSKSFAAAIQNLAQEGTVTHIAFPSHFGEVGKLIRRSFTKEVELSEEVLGYLMIADGHDRCDKVIYPALERGDTVICDRHPLVSAWAYQAEVFTHDEIVALQQRHRFMEPDITFILDVPPDVAAERIKARHGLQNLIYEKDDDGYRFRLRHRYSGYAALNPNTVILDATESPDQLLQSCVDLMMKHFSWSTNKPGELA